MSPAIVPPFLRPGETIAVVGPSSPVEKGPLEAGIAYLEGKGHPVIVDRGVFSRNGYLAGHDSDRAASLNRVIADKQVGAILFSRGGYGLTRILPYLDIPRLRRSPRVILAYSDATALFMALQRRGPYLVNYGPVVCELGVRNSFDESSFWSALYGKGGEAWQVPFDDRNVLRPGRCSGSLIGGCLTLLVNLLGTPYDPDYRKTILFWEETGEEPYRIDRMLTQLRNAGKFDDLAGMVVGSVSGKTPGGSGRRFQRILEEVAAGNSFPVVRGLRVGHTRKKLTLPLGAEAFLDTRKGLLRIRPATGRALRKEPLERPIPR